VRGWLEEAPLTLDGLLRRFTRQPDAPLREVIVTDIGRDGMLQGPSFTLYKTLMQDFPTLSFTASGGVSSLDDIRELDAAGIPKVIVGKALYEKHISLEDIALWSQNASSPASM
jgi:phosphoribosylformimino-5-aminoimidazole carboxamide ribotide isomerase